MDFERLADEFMDLMHCLRKRKVEKQITDSMHGEQFVLFYISKKDGNVIPSEISKEMEISSARIAAALNSLEEKGLITRKIDLNDRRRILVNLTDEGHEQARQHNQKITAITVNMMRYLGEHDANEFLRIIKRLADKDPEDFV